MALRQLLEVKVQAFCQLDIFGTVKLDRSSPCRVGDCIHAVAEECLVEFLDIPLRLQAAQDM